MFPDSESETRSALVLLSSHSVISLGDGEDDEVESECSKHYVEVLSEVSEDVALVAVLTVVHLRLAGAFFSSVPVGVADEEGEDPVAREVVDGHGVGSEKWS